MRLCKDCAWSERAPQNQGGESVWFCRVKSELIMDPVDGHQFWDSGSELCSGARNRSTHCGPGGRWWKARPAEKLARMLERLLKGMRRH